MANTAWRQYIERLREQTPTNVESKMLRKVKNRALGFMAFVVLDANEFLINRFRPDFPSIWNPSDLSWNSAVLENFALIQAETRDYMSAHALPLTAEINGLDPEGAGALASIPGGIGEWRSLVLSWFGHEIEPTASFFPQTIATLRGLEGVMTAGLSVLEGGGHIDVHRDPNKGSLRYQLPIIVPGSRGDCRIRVLDQNIDWVEGEPVVFDLAVNHEVWNDATDPRVLLMVEVVAPLDGLLRWSNRVAQFAYRFSPTYQGLGRRVSTLAQRATADDLPPSDS